MTYTVDFRITNTKHSDLFKATSQSAVSARELIDDFYLVMFVIFSSWYSPAIEKSTVTFRRKNEKRYLQI